MLRRREHAEDDGPPPLPPLRGLSLGLVPPTRGPNERPSPTWASDDEEKPGVAARRDLVTREAKLSLTDTISLLRARGPRPRLHDEDSDGAFDPHATSTRTGHEHAVAARSVRARQEDQYYSSRGATSRFATERVASQPVAAFPSSSERNQEIDKPIRLLTLADTITLPKARVRRPVMGRDRAASSYPAGQIVEETRRDRDRSYPGEHRFEDTSRDRNRSSGSGCDGPQCCFGPDFAVAGASRPARSSWASEVEPFDPSLGVLRRYPYTGEVQHLVSSTSTSTPTNSCRPTSAVSTACSSQNNTSGAPCCSGPEFAVREQQCSKRTSRTTTSVHVKDEVKEAGKSPPQSQSGEQASGFGFSLAETLMLPKPRARRPGVGRDSQRVSPTSSRGKTGDDLGGEYDDDDDRPCCLGPQYEIREGMTAEEIRNVKKARRKEQCRVNQANYRRRKRAVEMQTDREIQELHSQIEHLEVKRDNARKRARHTRDTELVLRDPMNLVQHIFLRLGPAQEVDRRLTRAPMRQVDAIVGLEYEEFSSVEDLLAQWKYHRSVFETFELRLRSVRSEQIGESLVLSAEATLQCTMVARPHTRYEQYGRSASVVTCPVVQRFVFEERDRTLVKVISEVDWLAGLRGHSTSPLVLAAELVASSSPSQVSAPCALGTCDS